MDHISRLLINPSILLRSSLIEEICMCICLHLFSQKLIPVVKFMNMNTTLKKGTNKLT